MLDKLADRIKKKDDFNKLNKVLENILYEAPFDVHAMYHGFVFGLFQSYPNMIYDYIRYKKLPSMSDHHVCRINMCIEWLARNEDLICYDFDQSVITLRELMFMSQLTLEFSEN